MIMVRIIRIYIYNFAFLFLLWFMNTHMLVSVKSITVIVIADSRVIKNIAADVLCSSYVE